MLFLTPHRVLFHHPQRSIRTRLNFPEVSNFAFYPIRWIYVQTEHKLAEGRGGKKPCFSVMVFHFLSAVLKYIYYTVILWLCQQSRNLHPQAFVYFGNLACNLAQRRYLFMSCTCLLSSLPYTRQQWSQSTTDYLYKIFLHVPAMWVNKQFGSRNVVPEKLFVCVIIMAVDI